MTLLGSDYFIQLCISWSSIALIYFDYALTFGMESRLIWGKRLRFTTFLYFCCRYALVANVVYLLTLTNHINTGKFVHYACSTSFRHSQSPLSCHTGFYIAEILGVLGRFAIVTIWGLRTYAVFSGNMVIGFFFGTIGLILVVLDIIDIPTDRCNGSNIFPFGMLISHDSGMFTPNGYAVGHLRAALMLFFEVSSTFLTTLRAIQSLRAGGGSLRASRRSLAYVVLEQGILYFCVVTGVTIASLVLNVGAPGIFAERLLSAHRGPLSGLMTARFVLHLRKWEDKHASPRHQVEDDKSGSDATKQTKILDELAENPHLARHALVDVPRNVVKDLYNLVQTDAERLHEEIKGLEERIQELRALKDVRTMQHELLAQFYLPDEILLHIFRFSFDHVDLPFVKTDPLWTLTWTCSRWRDIILNEPSFWSDIHGTIRKKCAKDITDVTREVYRRSRKCPLKLSIHCPHQRNSPGHIRRITRPLLTGIATRLSGLTINIPPRFMGWSNFGEHLPLIQRYSYNNPHDTTIVFPNLTELTIYYFDRLPVYVTEMMTALISRRMPYLTHLHLETEIRYTDYRSMFLGAHADWANLISVNLRNRVTLPFPQVHRLLKRCNRLASLEVLIGPGDGEEIRTISRSLPRIPLPTLRTLKVDVDEYSPGTKFPMALFCFIVLLDLPALDHLELNALLIESRRKLLLLNILSSHILTIKTIQTLIVGNGLKGAQVDNYIAALPNLRKLVISVPGDKLSRPAVTAIASGAWKTTLEQLMCSIAVEDVGAFVDLIQDHWLNAKAEGPSVEGTSTKVCIRHATVCIRGENPSAAAKKYGDIHREFRKKARFGRSYELRFLQFT